MEIVLDTNFILTCIKQKVDFDRLANELLDEEIKWLVPQEVLNELGNLKDRPGMRVDDKSAARLSFDILKHLNHEVVSLGSKHPNVDIALVNFVLGTKRVLATLDKGLKGRVDNPILTLKGKKSLQLL